MEMHKQGRRGTQSVMLGVKRQGSKGAKGAAIVEWRERFGERAIKETTLGVLSAHQGNTANVGGRKQHVRH